MKTLASGSGRAALAAVLTGAVAFGAAAQTPPTEVTQKGAIKGTMEIDFPTRYQLDGSGNPKPGVKDAYKLQLSVTQLLEFGGTIYRVPRLTSESGIVAAERETQGNQLEYSIDLSVLKPDDPTQKKAVGKWVGVVPIDAEGVYDLAGTTKSPHRIQVDAIGKVQAFTEKFGGSLSGKPHAQKEAKAVQFVRKIANKEVKIEVRNSDPMRFDSVVLAPGPLPSYPKTVVSGNLDYDYDTGNWLTNGVRFHYTLEGKDVEDIVTGTIKWVEDPARESNGKGHYEFNLRFNEAKATPAPSEADAFANLSDEDAFFAVDNKMPALVKRPQVAVR